MQDRIKELLEANNRYQQRGRMAERFARAIEQMLLADPIPPTRRDMLQILVRDYRQDFPRDYPL